MVNMARGRKGKVHTEDQIREAVNMYSNASVPYSKIVEETGVPKWTLDRYITKNGIEKTRRKMGGRSRKHVNGNQVNELILAGKSVKEVSEKLHMTVSTVKNNMSDDARIMYLSRTRRDRHSKTGNTGTDLSNDNNLKIAKKLYDDTQLTFKEIQEATGVPMISLKRYIYKLETPKSMPK